MRFIFGISPFQSDFIKLVLVQVVVINLMNE